jgi:lipid-A-disaccharide synthase-like uncharacterized protein
MKIYWRDIFEFVGEVINAFIAWTLIGAVMAIIFTVAVKVFRFLNV